MLAVILFIFSNPVEGYSVDPYRIFAQSDSVLSVLNSVQYDFTFRGTGALSNIIPRVDGMTSLGRLEGVNHPLMLHSFTGLTSDGAARDFHVPSSYAALEDSLYFVEHSNAAVYSSGYSITSEGMFNFPPSSVMMEYVLPNPFLDEIYADSVAVLYPSEVAGTECHVFHVYYDDEENSEAIWFIGIDDLLPRAVERTGYYGPESEPGGQLLEISNLIPEAQLPSVPEIPSGYSLLLWKSLLEPSAEAPKFFLADMNGRARRSTEFNDGILLLCFFSSWDSSSLSALGFLDIVSEEFSDEVHSVGISIGESADPGFRLNSLSIDFPIFLFGEKAADEYNVHSVPALFLISRDGEVLFSSYTCTDHDRSEIRRLIEVRM